MQKLRENHRNMISLGRLRGNTRIVSPLRLCSHRSKRNGFASKKLIHHFHECFKIRIVKILHPILAISECHHKERGICPFDLFAQMCLVAECSRKIATRSEYNSGSGTDIIKRKGLQHGKVVRGFKNCLCLDWREYAGK